jgi:Flp pilus assembly pilin Flp
MTFANDIKTLLTYLEARLDVRDQAGQTMAEYAVVLAVITVTMVAAIGLLSGNVGNVINMVAGYIK